DCRSCGFDLSEPSIWLPNAADPWPDMLCAGGGAAGEGRLVVRSVFDLRVWLRTGARGSCIESDDFGAESAGARLRLEFVEFLLGYWSSRMSICDCRIAALPPDLLVSLWSGCISTASGICFYPGSVPARKPNFDR